MKDDLEPQMNDDERIYSPKPRRIGSMNDKLFPILGGILIIVLFAGGLFYFITRGSSEGDAMIQSKVTDFEQKITTLEKQIAELQGKLGAGSPDPGLSQRLEALAQKVEALEKRAQPPTESKSKLAHPKPVVTAQKRYHTVQKGESLYSISKRYGITVEELRKLNNLSGDQSIKTGQRLIISLGP